MSIGQAIKNKFIESAALAADAKIDGREIGHTIREQIVSQTNAASARKIARGPITNFLSEVLEGLWENDKEALAITVRSWADTLTSPVKEVSKESKTSTNVSPGNTSTL